MKRVILLCLLCLNSWALYAQQAAGYSQKEITYDRRDGASLTMTVFTPDKAKGKGIISLLSGNFVSDYKWFDVYRDRALVMVNHGYTVFLVMHRSAPRFALPDMLEDIQRAVQFVRYHAAGYKINPAHIGITGTSSGGHLALLTALSRDIMDSASTDPIGRVSASVQAAAVFCPPTDLLNYGRAGYNLAQDKSALIQIGILGAFSYTEWDAVSRTFMPVINLQQRRKIDSLMSPTQIAGKNAPAIFLMHGDKDDLVPIQQSQILLGKLKNAGVPAKLVVKAGAGHGWKSMNLDEDAFNLWFDQYLQ